jgi:hypothetical protein
VSREKRVLAEAHALHNPLATDDGAGVFDDIPTRRRLVGLRIRAATELSGDTRVALRAVWRASRLGGGGGGGGEGGAGDTGDAAAAGCTRSASIGDRDTRDPRRGYAHNEPSSSDDGGPAPAASAAPAEATAQQHLGEAIAQAVGALPSVRSEPPPAVAAPAPPATYERRNGSEEVQSARERYLARKRQREG